MLLLVCQLQVNRSGHYVGGDVESMAVCSRGSLQPARISVKTRPALITSHTGAAHAVHSLRHYYDQLTGVFVVVISGQLRTAVAEAAAAWNYTMQ